MLGDVEAYSNLQTVMVEQLLLMTFRELRLFIRERFGRSTPYINTWGDGITLIARGPIKAAIISINFRDCFLRSQRIMREDRSVNLRIALDCGLLAEWKSGFTGSREYAGTPPTAAPRLATSSHASSYVPSGPPGSEHLRRPRSPRIPATLHLNSASRA